MLISELKINTFYKTHGFISFAAGVSAGLDLCYIYGDKQTMKQYRSGRLPAGLTTGWWKDTPGAMMLYLGSHSRPPHPRSGRRPDYVRSFHLLGYGKIALYGNDVQFLKEVKHTA